jgi:hypothetical protein
MLRWLLANKRKQYKYCFKIREDNFIVGTIIPGAKARRFSDERTKVNLQAFFTLVQDGDECLVSLPGHFDSEERNLILIG